MELSSPKIKKVLILIFSQKKAFLIFWEMEIFFKKNIFGGNFASLKNKKKDTLKRFLIFREMEFSSPKHKRFLIFFLRKIFLAFQEGTYKAPQKFFLYYRITADEAVK